MFRKPNQEAYENYFRTDIVSESKRLFSDFSGVPARARSLAVFRLSVRGARREFEDQFRGLPIELVDLKNKFLGPPSDTRASLEASCTAGGGWRTQGEL